ncbi:hypothetical protein GCM10009757_30850 [Streptomyces cheonanensis]|uniref:Uncharacterized protein n=1 Tax=Streptomyces cheonanensis TaxID=312720 RepID=A0ABP5GRJ4_9ACTN
MTDWLKDMGVVCLQKGRAPGRVQMSAPPASGQRGRAKWRVGARDRKGEGTARGEGNRHPVTAGAGSAARYAQSVQGAE